MNFIEIQINHEMFFKEFSGEIDNFIYDEFGIILTDGKEISALLYVFYDKQFIGTEICLLCLNNSHIEEDVRFKIYANDKSSDGMDVMCTSDKSVYLNIGHDVAQLVGRIITYIMTTKRDSLTKKSNSKIERRKKNKKKIYKDANIYLLDEIVEYVNENGLTVAPSSTHKINCPCWSVRGHYRHYKSGKVVFIKNYEKGKEKGKKKPKEKIYTV